MLKTVEIGKFYNDKAALNKVSLTFPDKGLVVVKGESGSGKSTLLNMLTALDYPTTGRVEYDGVELNSKNGEDYRRKYCGNIYQDYMLIGGLSVKENIELGLQASGEPYVAKDIILLLTEVGLPENYADKKVSKLSGGEKQRVSIARAIAKRHAMIFADEPTGNLDGKNGAKIMDILKKISKDRLVVVVSHNEKFNAIYADYTVELVDGMIKNSDLPIAQDSNDSQKERREVDLDGKSKLLPKTIARLAFWGFEKNKVKTIVSIVAFIMICVLSLVFTVGALGDTNLAYASSLKKCKSKNLLAFINGSSFGFSVIDDLSWSDLNNFKKGVDLGCSEVYGFSLIGDAVKTNSAEVETYREKYNALPSIKNAILYNSEIGMDVKVWCGDFPQKLDDVMLPYSFAQYMTTVCVDYKTDSLDTLVGKELICGSQSKGRYFTLSICGVFEDGPYFSDFEKTDEDTANYFIRTNELAHCAVFSPEIKDAWFKNQYSFNIQELGISNANDMRINKRTVYPYGYDENADYAKDYAPLKEGEIYLDKTFAQAQNIKAGDVLTGTSMREGSFMTGSKTSDFDGLVVKDLFDSPGRKDFIIFSSEDYDGWIVKDKMYSTFRGFYFNMKDVGDVYGALKKIASVGYKENFWSTSNAIDKVYTENINATSGLWSMFLNYKYFAFLPLTLVSLLGLVALGYVSIDYLLSSKSKSYNILRSLGFGKKSLLIVVLIQVLTVIISECVLGISMGALTCHLLGRAFLDGNVPTAIATEVPMPIGYVAPLIVIAVSVLTGVTAAIVKTHFIFKKSIIENKTG